MGVSNCPDTKEKAQQLLDLMKQPILQETAEDILYSLIACDDLFDDIGYCQPGSDIRQLVQNKLGDWLDELDAFVKPWEPEAITICEKIVTGQY